MNMKRIHLFEFTDLPWYPDVFRRIQTDYLQFVASLGSGHKHLIPLFQPAPQGEPKAPCGRVKSPVW